MSWPSPQEYNEAIQNPHLNLADRELAAGEAQVTPLGLPRPITGNFASVYRLRCGSRDWAVRCFWREFSDMHERYTAIGEHLSRAQLPFMVGFDYAPHGIRVGGAWYPLLRMEWVDGVLLSAWIAQNLQRPESLRHMAKEWLTLTEQLERAGVAHCDLQHGNILVSTNGLQLVDYDAMFVPALGGRGSHELGHQHYQHPARTAADFDAGTDCFSAWVIYLSIVGLAAQPDLWALSGAGDESLLLRRQDYENPVASVVLQALENSPDPVVRRLTVAFVAALRRGPGTLASLSASVSSGRPVRNRPRAKLETAALPEWLRDHVAEELNPSRSFRLRRSVAAGAIIVPAVSLPGLLVLPGERLLLFPIVALSMSGDALLAIAAYVRDEDGGRKARARARIWYTRLVVRSSDLLLRRLHPWHAAMERVCTRQMRVLQQQRDRSRACMVSELATVAIVVAENEAQRATEIATATAAIRERRTSAINARRERERRKALKGARVRFGLIPSISAWQVVRLHLFGIRSADAVNDGALARARRISPSLPVALARWRAEVEQRAYRHAPTTLSDADEKRLRAHLLKLTERSADRFAQRRTKLEGLASEIEARQIRRDVRLRARQQRWEMRVEHRRATREAFAQQTESQRQQQRHDLFERRLDLDEYSDVSFVSVMLRALGLREE